MNGLYDQDIGNYLARFDQSETRIAFEYLIKRYIQLRDNQSEAVIDPYSLMKKILYLYIMVGMSLAVCSQSLEYTW